MIYDVEFPELSRLMADQGMNILFVPFLTDTQNGYTRVKHCAQAEPLKDVMWPLPVVLGTK
jgi:predicted amidohydrolase